MQCAELVARANMVLFKQGLNVLYASKDHQSSLRRLIEETELSNHTSEACEALICAVCTAVTVAGTKVNDVHYWMFCQKGQRNENLPSTSDSLQQHMKLGNSRLVCVEESAGGNTESTVTKWVRLENGG